MNPTDDPSEAPAIDFERVGDVFAEALEAPPEERRALLDAVARDSPEVAHRAESLLRAHHSPSILDSSLDAQKAARLIETADLSPLPGPIGPYRIVRELGRGGMGVVYLAERAEGGFEQRVALKLVKRGMDSEAILARFLQERQILARLEHPGIARLLDGGLTENGQPYFAMEHVEGEAITRYCTRLDLSLQDRLALFSSVCEAVQYAHGRLVVHRDLKPSNVLVTAEGSVKLVDFGIAKVLDSSHGVAGETALTAQGVRPLTPEYASPEQVRGEGVTVASDVYALGVLLYQLLVGRSPYPTPLSTPDEIRRAVCETEPLAPSAAVLDPKRAQGAQDDDSPRRHQQQQGLESHRRERSRLAKKIRGDLDNVILKALAKEATQRYPSVEALAEDLHRYRDGLPVRAHRAGSFYRAKKFVGRHRVAVAAATAALLALLIGLGGTAWQANVAAGERDRARLESEKLLATQEYLVGLFDAADPSRALGKDVTAKELVARGVERLETELQDQPEVRLEMLETLSRVSAALGEVNQTGKLLERGLVLAKELHGESHLTVADLLANQGRFYNAKGAWTEATTTLEEALALYSRLGNKDRSAVMKALSQLAFAHKSLGDLESAATVLHQALDEARELFGSKSQEAADLLNDLGNVLKRAGDYQAAENALGEALAIWRELYGPEHPDIAIATGNLAVVLFRKGDWQRAEGFFRDAIAMERRLRGDKHPGLGAKLHNLANFLHALGRYGEAATLHREVLAMVRDTLGEASPYYATTVDSLARDLARGGHFQEAMPLFEEAELLLLKAVGPEHEYYALHLSSYASAFHLQGLNSRAMPLIEQSIRIVRDQQRPESLAAKLVERGTIRLSLGALDDAEEDFRAALLEQREALPKKHPDLVTTLTGLGWALIARGKPGEAFEILKEAASLADEALPEEHWRRAEAHAALGASLLELERHTEGEPLLRQAHGQLAVALGPDHPTTHRAARYLR